MRSFSEALDWITSQVSHPTQRWGNKCQSVSRQAVGAEPFGQSAREAFNSIPPQYKHTSWPPPAGSIAYWGVPNRGSGHATFVGEGVFFSSDIRRHDKVDTVPIPANKDHAAFTMEWGLPYRGWIDWCPSGKLDVQLAGKPAPGKHEEQVRPPAPAVVPVLPDVHLLLVQPGKSNDEVKLVQKALQRMGVECGPVDGVFGPVTQKGYSQWQKICGFSGKAANGAPGEKTLHALGIATHSFFAVA